MVNRATFLPVGGGDFAYLRLAECAPRTRLAGLLPPFCPHFQLTVNVRVVERVKLPEVPVTVRV